MFIFGLRDICLQAIILCKKGGVQTKDWLDENCPLNHGANHVLGKKLALFCRERTIPRNGKDNVTTNL